LAALITAGAVSVAAAAKAAPAFGAPLRQGGAEIRTVTLVTGDRVTVLGDDAQSVLVEPGAGRAHITFVTRRTKEHLQLIPSDAVGLMDTGRLDPRLFDVTTLLAYGYDDRRAELPLLITTNGAGAARVTAAAITAEAAGARVTRRLPCLGAVAVRQDRKRASAIWQDLTRRSGTAEALPPGVSKVWLDGIRRPVLDVSVPLIGAPSAWQAGYTGKDVEVAVLDTGVDDTHPDLAGRVVARSNFTDGAEDDLDHLGHGTHVASTIAGSGAASGGRYRGVAPDAGLADGKVCVVDGCAESWILAGMDWAAAARHAQVVNLSLGGPDFPGVDPLEEAVNTLTAQYGTLFVIAAGNEGEDASVGSPASADAALAVGAVTKTDQLADFSSRVRERTTVASSRTSPRPEWTSWRQGPRTARSANQSATATCACQALPWPPRTWPAPRRSWPNSIPTGPPARSRPR